MGASHSSSSASRLRLTSRAVTSGSRGLACLSEKPPAGGRSPLLQRLADVELQLVMHGLEAAEILTLARCHRRLLHAANSAFAWKQAPTLCLRSIPAADSDSALLPPLVARYSSIGLVLTNPYVTPKHRFHSRRQVRVQAEAKAEQQANAEADRLLAFAERCAARAPAGGAGAGVGKVHLLDMRHSHFARAAQWERMLLSPALRELRVLVIQDLHHYQGPMQLGVMRAIADMPHLHTLTVASMHNESAEHWSLLAEAPALTSLSFIDSLAQNYSRLMHVAQCPQLRHLAVIRPGLYGRGTFARFFESPRIQALETLQLDTFWLEDNSQVRSVPPSAAVLAASFISMRCLHSLHLRHVYAIDSIFPALAHAPVLVRLKIEPHAQAKRDGSYSSSPSPQPLSQLLMHTPALSCILLLPHGSIDRAQRKEDKKYCTFVELHLVADPALRECASRFAVQLA